MVDDNLPSVFAGRWGACVYLGVWENGIGMGWMDGDSRLFWRLIEGWVKKKKRNHGNGRTGGVQTLE
jgi:hypothetical protein